MKQIFKNIFQYVLIIFIAIVLAILLRVFLFASFKIPSPSMEPAILSGDYIIVNKQIPGPRIIKNFFSSQKNDRWGTKRFKGIRKIKRNDMQVFNTVINKN
jgi:signal peptidase I